MSPLSNTTNLAPAGRRLGAVHPHPPHGLDHGAQPHAGLPGEMVYGALVGGVFAVVFQPEAVLRTVGEPELARPVPSGQGRVAGAARRLRPRFGERGPRRAALARGMASMLQTVSLIVATLATAFGVKVLASDQYISIVLPSRMFRSEYQRRRLDPKNLSRTLEDSGTITSVLIPWNTCGAFMAQTLGVSTLTHVPFAFFNLINPFVAAFYGCARIGIAPLDSAAAENPRVQPPSTRRPRREGSRSKRYGCAAPPAAPDRGRQGRKVPSEPPLGTSAEQHLEYSRLGLDRHLPKPKVSHDTFRDHQEQCPSSRYRQRGGAHEHDRIRNLFWPPTERTRTIRDPRWPHRTPSHHAVPGLPVLKPQTGKPAESAYTASKATSIRVEMMSPPRRLNHCCLLPSGS